MSDQIDIAITLNVSDVRPKDIPALEERLGDYARKATGGELVKCDAHFVSDYVAALTWSNPLAREFAWLVADREDETGPAVIEWINDNEDDESVWGPVSDLIDELTRRSGV